MDTSKEYIKMCEKAVEVQELWNMQSSDVVKGDFVGFIDTLNGFASLKRLDYDDETFGKYAWYEKNELLWLPRQDQLQRILSDDVDKLCKRIFDWIEFTYPVMGGMNFEPKSMEQLWLAFVMKEKFNKTWDGNKWIFQNQ